MRSRLIVVTGTGTGIGKTHFAEALLLAWREAGQRVVGLKPVESGVAPGAEGDSDAARLGRASSFHVKQSAYVFAEPISPHLAARRNAVTLQPELLEEPILAARDEADVVVAELPGGLFTPLAPGMLNADFAARLRPDALLLAAPDRLGVLHDVTSTVRAATAMHLELTAVVLIAPDMSDASTGLNAAELPVLVPVPVLGPIPRGSPRDLARSPELHLIQQRLAR
jgi:dethiobiotin synthetase